MFSRQPTTNSQTFSRSVKTQTVGHEVEYEMPVFAPVVCEDTDHGSRYDNPCTSSLFICPAVGADFGNRVGVDQAEGGCVFGGCDGVFYQ